MKSINLLILGTMTAMAVLISSCTGEIKQKETTPPNILLCIADDAAFPHMSAYGTSWVKTPGFDRVADQGILLTNAYTPNAKCAPSRSILLTGRNSWQLEEAANHWCYFPEKFKTSFEAFTEQGYHVGFTGKGAEPIVEGEIDGNPRLLTGKEYGEKKLTPPTSHISNTDYAENFREFIKSKPDDKPFCFWYGAKEPHRGYEFKSGVNKANKSLDQIDRVYDFWPDIDSVRHDILDYAMEVEHFDQHVQKILTILAEEGELKNTLVIVTSDHGMPFPRAKGQAYERSNHVPMAIMWKNGIEHTGRIVNDFVSFADIAPTMFEVSSINPEEAGMEPMVGRSLTDIMYSDKSGTVNPTRDHMIIGKERHDIGRPDDVGYPIRGIIKNHYLYVHNFETNRWPAGNPETGYLNCDGSPTKTVILDRWNNSGEHKYWKWSFGKRPQEELYFLKDDPDCINNLSDLDAYDDIKEKLKNQLFSELKEQGDPRMHGNGAVFDDYEYANPEGENFYERHKLGEEMNTSWVNDSDFRPEQNLEKKKDN